MDRRTSTGSVSPSAARHWAIRSHIATKKITSPAFAFTIRVLSPNSSDCPVVTNRANDSATRRASAAAGSASMIRAATRSVNGFHANASTYGATAASTSEGLLQGQAGGVGQLRDLPGLPHPGPPVAEGRPQDRVPVPQVQGVPDQVVRRDRAGPHQHPELRTGELRHRRRARPADPPRPLHPRQHRTRPTSGWCVRRAGPPSAPPTRARATPPPAARAGCPRPPGTRHRRPGQRSTRCRTCVRFYSHPPTLSRPFPLSTREISVTQPGRPASTEQSRSRDYGELIPAHRKSLTAAAPHASRELPASASSTAGTPNANARLWSW